MADPTIQTFCCHHSNETNVAQTVIEKFNTNAYNAICIFSSILGIFGAVYQIIPREQFASNHRWLSHSAIRGRKIIVWLAFADLLAALGVLTRSSLWIRYKNIMPAVDDGSSVVFCAVSSAFTQYFYMASWMWTLCYAIDIRFLLYEKPSKLALYHCFAWILPCILTVTGLSILYIPDANCHIQMSLQTAILRILPNYIATYLPMTIVMIANPYLYLNSSQDMEKIITSSSGQLTSRERDLINSIKIKFSVINIIYFACWIPNLLNGILLWTLWLNLPVKCIISLWYIMAFLNPLQAFFNCLVYRRWNKGSERIVIPWTGAEEVQLSNKSSSLESTGREEIYPLLKTAPANSVNDYKTNKFL